MGISKRGIEGSFLVYKPVAINQKPKKSFYLKHLDGQKSNYHLKFNRSHYITFLPQLQKEWNLFPAFTVELKSCAI